MPVYEHMVSINGLSYPLRTDKDIDYVRRVTEMLQSRMDDIKGKVKVLDTQKLAVMAALSFAAQYLDEKEGYERSELIIDEILQKLEKKTEML